MVHGSSQVRYGGRRRCAQLRQRDASHFGIDVRDGQHDERARARRLFLWQAEKQRAGLDAREVMALALRLAIADLDEEQFYASAFQPPACIRLVQRERRVAGDRQRRAGRIQQCPQPGAA